MKEFLYILKECGLSQSVFYFFYKIKLKYRQLINFEKLCKIEQEKIQNIYEALAFQDQENIYENGERFVLYPIPAFNQLKIKLRPFTSDWKVLNQIFIQKEYQPVIDIYHQFFDEKPKIVIDCGSNIGFASIWFHIHYPSAKIIAVEPFLSNYLIAEKNMNACGIQDYKLLHGGIWNSETMLSIDRTFRDGKEWSISLQESKNGKGDIKGYSLTEIIENLEGNIDILKIDIEGSEKELFNDINYASIFLKKVKCLVIEIHDEFLIREKIYDALNRNNFFYFNNAESTIAINRNLIN